MQVQDHELQEILDDYCIAPEKPRALDDLIPNCKLIEGHIVSRLSWTGAPCVLCLTGENGTGKVTLAHDVLQRLPPRDDNGFPVRVLSADFFDMAVGATVNGQTQARIKTLLDGICERGGIVNGQEIVLVLENLNEFLPFFKKALKLGACRIVGTMTPREYDQAVMVDEVLKNAFHKVDMSLKPMLPDDVAFDQKRAIRLPPKLKLR